MKMRQPGETREEKEEEKQENGRRSVVVLHLLMHVTNFEPHAP